MLFLMIFALLLGVIPWSNIMEILEEKDGVDTELLVYAMTLVNKVGQCFLWVSLFPPKAMLKSWSLVPMNEAYLKIQGHVVKLT